MDTGVLEHMGSFLTLTYTLTDLYRRAKQWAVSSHTHCVGGP